MTAQYQLAILLLAICIGTSSASRPVLWQLDAGRHLLQDAYGSAVDALTPTITTAEPQLSIAAEPVAAAPAADPTAVVTPSETAVAPAAEATPTLPFLEVGPTVPAPPAPEPVTEVVLPASTTTATPTETAVTSPRTTEVTPAMPSAAVTPILPPVPAPELALEDVAANLIGEIVAAPAPELLQASAPAAEQPTSTTPSLVATRPSSNAAAAPETTTTADDGAVVMSEVVTRPQTTFSAAPTAEPIINGDGQIEFAALTGPLEYYDYLSTLLAAVQVCMWEKSPVAVLFAAYCLLCVPSVVGGPLLRHCLTLCGELNCCSRLPAALQL